MEKQKYIKRLEPLVKKEQMNNFVSDGTEQKWSGKGEDIAKFLAKLEEQIKTHPYFVRLGKVSQFIPHDPEIGIKIVRPREERWRKRIEDRNFPEDKKIKYKYKLEKLTHTEDEYNNRKKHSEDVAEIAGSIARKLGLSKENTHIVEITSLLHDIGHAPFNHYFQDATESLFPEYGLDQHYFEHNRNGLIKALNMGMPDIILEILIYHDGKPLKEVQKKYGKNKLPDPLRKFTHDLEKQPSIVAQIAAIADDIANETRDLENILRSHNSAESPGRTIEEMAKNSKLFEIAFNRALDRIYEHVIEQEPGYFGKGKYPPSAINNPVRKIIHDTEKDKSNGNYFFYLKIDTSSEAILREIIKELREIFVNDLAEETMRRAELHAKQGRDIGELTVEINGKPEPIVSLSQDKSKNIYGLDMKHALADQRSFNRKIFREDKFNEQRALLENNIKAIFRKGMNGDLSGLPDGMRSDLEAVNMSTLPAEMCKENKVKIILSHLLEMGDLDVFKIYKNINPKWMERNQSPSYTNALTSTHYF